MVAPRRPVSAPGIYRMAEANALTRTRRQRTWPCRPQPSQVAMNGDTRESRPLRASQIDIWPKGGKSSNKGQAGPDRATEPSENSGVGIFQQHEKDAARWRDIQLNTPRRAYNLDTQSGEGYQEIWVAKVSRESGMDHKGFRKGALPFLMAQWLEMYLGAVHQVCRDDGQVHSPLHMLILTALGQRTGAATTSRSTAHEFHTANIFVWGARPLTRGSTQMSTCMIE